MSGGQSASRGFLIQSITCILKSLREKDWDKVEIEPKEHDEKIDLKWYVGDNIKVASQVKSSINSFSKEKVIYLLSQMIESCPEAQILELVLVGKFEDGIIEFSRKINGELQFNASEKKNLSHVINQKTRIELHNFDREITNNSSIFVQMKDEVHKYLPADIRLSHDDLSALSLALIGQFSLFSTNGQKVTKDELNRMIKVMIKDRIEEIRMNNPLNEIIVNQNNFDFEFNKAMEHEVVKQWYNKRFQKSLSFLICEIAMNAFVYGGATQCNFEIYHDKVVLKDNGIKFDISKDSPEFESSGAKLGTATFKQFFNEYSLVARYHHEYNDNKVNITTINIIQDFGIFIENNCDVITKGRFTPTNRKIYEKCIDISIPSDCENFVYYSGHLFATAESTLINLILSKLPSQSKLIVKFSHEYPSADMIREVFDDNERLEFEQIESRKLPNY